MSWAHALAFRAGDGHERCDDICICEPLGDTIVAAVSDGAGSAKGAHVGASIACQAFLELAPALLTCAADPSVLIATIRERLPDGLPEDFASTLVGAICGPKQSLIIQVGDGACVFRKESESRVAVTSGAHSSAGWGGEALASKPAADVQHEQAIYEVAIWPEETEFLNHTFFVTAPDAEEHLRVRRFDEPLCEIALMTDGLQHLVLDLKTRAPHQPFFQSVFKRLGDDAERDEKASAWLERTLASDPVTKRTDDDTSIVIARRLASC